MYGFFSHPILAVLLCYAWCLIVWKYWINDFSWGVLRIPIGMTGAMYPLFFTLPVLIITAVYEFYLPLLASHLHYPDIAASLMWRTGLPFAVSTILLLVFCPMDYGAPYLVFLIRSLKDRRHKNDPLPLKPLVRVKGDN